EIDIDQTEAQRGAVVDRIRHLAVTEFVGSGNGEVDAYWSAPDLNAATRQRGLFDNVTDSEVDAVDELRRLESDLDGLVAEEEANRLELVELEAEREARLEDLDAALVEQERLQAALEARIDEFVAEADALAAEEDELTALLQQQVADEEAAAAAAAAAAAPPTGESPAAPSGGDSGGGGGGSGPANPGPGLSWPAGGVVTSGFGPRWGRMHQGIDIAAASGTPVYAAAGGVVIQAGFNGGYGNAVVIDHGSGLSTVYAHHSSLTVSAGQSVGRGTQVGLMGSTGNSTGPHVHFEVRINGVAYNPMSYLG
ncbi:MAG: peptidoglycan DD-metalloendopeptidase family protein, partial [Acidimicrobiia bacterium]|nr:peptidoglycan DD-metalloendopeptidase family protein [Acidimicrobiia bacterium]